MYYGGSYYGGGGGYGGSGLTGLEYRDWETGEIGVELTFAAVDRGGVSHEIGIDLVFTRIVGEGDSQKSMAGVWEGEFAEAMNYLDGTVDENSNDCVVCRPKISMSKLMT